MSGLVGVQLVLSVVYVVITLSVALAVLVGAVVHRREVRDSWTAGAAASAVVLLLAAPMQVLTLVHLDLDAVLNEIVLPADQLARVQVIAWWASLGGAIGAAALSFAYRVLLVPVAIAAAPRRSPYPLLLGDVGAFGGVVQGTFLGGVLGAVSVVLFWLLGVTEGELMTEQLAWFPDVDWRDPGVVFGVTLPVMVAAAISEEMLFRGVMQRWITRWLGGRWPGATFAILVTSLVWTIGHAANTDHLVLKMAQIFGLGVVFGALSHRWSVEAALAAHVTLNLVAVIGGFLLVG